MTHRDPGRARPAPTLEMVAALAGVSRATVSRVVNDSPSVDPQRARAVRDAIAALNYVPNRAARSLASRRTQAVTLVLPESASKVFTDPFFASVIAGIAGHLADTDYTLTMILSSESAPEKTRRYLLGGNVDGALVVSHHSGDNSWARVGGALPIVFAGRPLVGEPGSHYVEVENESGAAAATDLLLSRGRRNLATIAGPQDMPAGIDRLAGWSRALAGAGLNASNVEFGDFTPASGAAAMRRLLARGTPIDGLFVASAQMAAGAYPVLAAHSLRIPEDMAVVGFDDDEFAAALSPALTTVRHPVTELGARMAEKLVALIEGRPVERVTRLGTSLILRGSA